VLAVRELNRGFDFQAGFANKFGGCVCITTTTKRRRSGWAGVSPHYTSATSPLIFSIALSLPWDAILSSPYRAVCRIHSILFFTVR
jgi:hypothetical protein